MILNWISLFKRSVLFLSCSKLLQFSHIDQLHTIWRNINQSYHFKYGHDSNNNILPEFHHTFHPKIKKVIHRGIFYSWTIKIIQYVFTYIKIGILNYLRIYTQKELIRSFHHALIRSDFSCPYIRQWYSIALWFPKLKQNVFCLFVFVVLRFVKLWF